MHEGKDALETIEQHAMQLAAAHPSGAEEWHCPSCGRRVLLEWPPARRRVVLAAGDPAALHSGGHAGGMPRAQESVAFASPGAQGLGGYASDEHDALADDLRGLSEAELPELLRPWFRAIQALEDRGLG
jgi:hypothetical protein